MKSKAFPILLCLVALSSLAIAGCLEEKKEIASENKIVTLQGEFEVTKGCMGTVEGVLLTEFTNKCEDTKNYSGKIVEITGYVSEHECAPEEQCFNGPYMSKIESIKIIER